MAIPLVIDSLEEVAEAFRKEYVAYAGDTAALKGKFVLDGTPAHGLSLSNVGALESTVGRLRNENKELKLVADSWKGVEGEPAEIATKLTKLDELLKIDPDKKADELAVEKSKAQIQAVREETGKEIKALKGHREVLVGQLVKALKVDRARQAILSSKDSNGQPDANVALLQPVVLERMDSRVNETTGEVEVFVKDAAGEPRMTADGGFAGPDAIVAELKENPEYAPAFSLPRKSGSHPPPGQQQRRTVASGEDERSSVQKIADGLTNLQPS